MRQLLTHHLGREYPEGLAHDLFRYCTRLRCQPDTRAHTVGCLKRSISRTTRTIVVTTGA